MYIFINRHLKLEIALTIPISNVWKIAANNAAEQCLGLDV